MASVVLRPGKTLDTNDLITFCRQYLAGYKIPKKIDISTNELPKSGSGKILKKDLRDRFWAGRERAVG